VTGRTRLIKRSTPAQLVGFSELGYTNTLAGERFRRGRNKSRASGVSTSIKGGESMSRLQVGMLFVSSAVAVLLAASGSWAQDALSAKLDPSGMIQVIKGDAELAMIELNAHGPDWKHAPQASATAEVSDLPDQAGKRFVGTLPIPNTNGGAIKFTESVKTVPQGLQLEYDLSMAEAMKLNGLQLSVCLPVAQYGGKELVIAQADGEPQTATLPQEQRKQTFQVWSGEGAKVEAAKGTDEAVTVELRAPTDVVVQDLRQWEQPVFEIRFPAIMEDQGRDVTADDKFHLDLTITFAAPVRLVGP
jgi:hypothetical protein